MHGDMNISKKGWTSVPENPFSHLECGAFLEGRKRSVIGSYRVGLDKRSARLIIQ